MHPVLARTLGCIERAVAGMSAADLERHPPGKWSAAEILEHLSLTFDGTRRNFQKRLDTGARSASLPTVRQCLAVLRVVELGRFPSGQQAPALTRPEGRLRGDNALEEIRCNFAAMDSVMNEAEARFGRRGRIANHPILGPLSLRQWRRFHLVHTRHHMKQIAALRQYAHSG